MARPAHAVSANSIDCTGSSAEPLDMDNPENLAILKILVQTDERSPYRTPIQLTK